MEKQDVTEALRLLFPACQITGRGGLWFARNGAAVFRIEATGQGQAYLVEAAPSEIDDLRESLPSGAELAGGESWLKVDLGRV